MRSEDVHDESRAVCDVSSKNAASFTNFFVRHLGEQRSTQRAFRALDAATAFSEFSEDGCHVIATSMADSGVSCGFLGVRTLLRNISKPHTGAIIEWWPQRGSNPCFSLERAVS